LSAGLIGALYAPDAVLLPTLSPKIRTDHDGIVDYFEHFLAKNPSGERTRSVVEVPDGTTAIDTGLYRFTSQLRTVRRRSRTRATPSCTRSWTAGG
jgi:hypothetical protein